MSRVQKGWHVTFTARGSHAFTFIFIKIRQKIFSTRLHILPSICIKFKQRVFYVWRVVQGFWRKFVVPFEPSSLIFQLPLSRSKPILVRWYISLLCSLYTWVKEMCENFDWSLLISSCIGRRVYFLNMWVPFIILMVNNESSKMFNYLIFFQEPAGAIIIYPSTHYSYYFPPLGKQQM